MSFISGSPEAPGLVLDTNVVLDWLLFSDPACTAIVAAIESGTVRWVVAQALRDECAAVLARGVGAARRPDLAVFWQHWDRHAKLQAVDSSFRSVAACRCSDPDDQKFIDLALQTGARWLLSHDKAVLKLASAARRAGLLILPPGAWQSSNKT